jgi:alcohol dehydrogenase
MMLSANLQPLAAILDYELTLSMPRGLTAAVGVDTLTHGIEAFVSKKANLLTDAIALNCIRLTALHLKAAWTDPQNRVAREGMMLAAYQGGLAFSNSSVCLVHGMARPLGAIFHLPHGLANAVLLPSVTRYSAPAAPARYAAIAKTIGLEGANDESACQSLITWLERLNLDLELPRLGACRGMNQTTFAANLNKMASDALASGSPGNNPRVPSESDIADLYREAW